MEEKFNGWTNQETWATALHIDNDRGLYEWAQECAKAHNIPFKFEEELKEFIMEEVLSYENIKENHSAYLMLTDIGSLDRVNWREISEAIWSEVHEDEEVNA